MWYKYFHIVYFFCLTTAISGQEIEVNIGIEGIWFMENQDSILFYQSAQKSLNGAYQRANYIHPLYTLDGEVLTEDFPSDHLHHRGIFWAWHQLYVGKKRIGDGWEIKDMAWEVIAVKELDEKGDTKTIQSQVLWKSPLWLDDNGIEKALVQELTTIKVYPSNSLYRQIDITISILGLEENMSIGGSEDKKGYGGFSTRIRLSDDVQFSNVEGTVKSKNLPVKASAWMDISGSLGKEGASAGLTIMAHPENPGYPNPWILRAKNSMQNAVYPSPGAKAVPLSADQATILRYRLIVHKGNAGMLDIESILADFSKS